LLPYNDFTLRSELNKYKIYYNNLGTAGGTMIIIHTSVIKFYDIIKFKLGKAALGRVQAFRLNPVRQKGAGTQRYDLPLNIINWHLEGDKNAQLSTLLRVNSKVRTIAGGDCNFVISSEDAPSNSSGIIIGGKLKKTWDSVASHFRFAEVSQPTHTHYFVPKDLNYEKVRTSRIDRIYISTDLVVWWSSVSLFIVCLLLVFDSIMCCRRRSYIVVCLAFLVYKRARKSGTSRQRTKAPKHTISRPQERVKDERDERERERDRERDREREREKTTWGILCTNQLATSWTVYKNHAPDQ
jgi:hypothetical protein